MGASIQNGFKAEGKVHATLPVRREGAAAELEQALAVTGMSWLPRSVRAKAQAIVDEHMGKRRPDPAQRDVTDGDAPDIDPAQRARVAAAKQEAVKNLDGFEVLASAEHQTINARRERDGLVVARVGYVVHAEAADEATINVKFRMPTNPAQAEALLRAISAATCAYEAALVSASGESSDAA